MSIILLSYLRNKMYSQTVTIKSKYLGLQQNRTISIHPSHQQISISHASQAGQAKDFHLDQLNSHNHDGNTLHLAFDNGRTYEVESMESHLLVSALKHSRNMHMCSRLVEQPLTKPEGFANYEPIRHSMSLLALGEKQAKCEDNVIKEMFGPSIIQKQRTATKREDLKSKPKRSYTCLLYFKDPNDWRITEEEGYAIILNQEWRSNATKIVSFLVKKFMTSGSFMGLSFPVFAMKPESILETYAKSIASAPKIFKQTQDHIERIKQFTCFLWSMSLIQLTLLKPFNPVIGQTFQADINGGIYSAQQVSHHPPVSAFHYSKDNYQIYASIELSASIGLNSGEGRFLGDITIQYSDGHWIKGRLPNGELTGVMFGETKLHTFGGAYIYDSNNLFLTYQLNKGRKIFEGNLGTLKHKAKVHFQKCLMNNDRFIKFQAYREDEYSKIYQKLEVKPGNWISFNGKKCYNFRDDTLLPYKLLTPQDNLLKSDSRYRQDIKWLKEHQIDKSQSQKERIENMERVNRKLRQTYSK